MPRNLVLFDLEWNIGYKPYNFNYHGVQQTFRGEIIEIGAVKIDEDANVLDTFSIHLRPRIFRCLQHHIAKVTGLTQEDLDKGEPIIQGLRRFMKWCGPDAEFAEWGMDDVRCSSRTFSSAISTRAARRSGTTCSSSFCGSTPARKARG